MKILFHTNTLNYRGTTVALRDYAHYNRTLLGNESVLAYDASLDYFQDGGNEQEVVTHLQQDYEVVDYSNREQLYSYCKENQIDVAYFIKSGSNDGLLVPNIKNVVHCVFQDHDPHGDVYAYVSQWLSEKITQSQYPWVPHIVQLPEPDPEFRQQFREAAELEDKIVIGRYGGLSTFDLPWVHEALISFADQNPNYHFVFVNTYQFTHHPSFLFVGTIEDPQKKSNYISTTDAMIHGRSNGESFGLAISEFMLQNKPVFSWSGGHDGNHRLFLEGKDSLYDGPIDLMAKLSLLQEGYDFGDYKTIVDPFRPEPVMKKFQEIFLN